MLLHPCQLALGFDVFRQGIDVERVGDVEQIGANACLVRIPIDVTHEFHVELDYVGTKQRNQVQKGIARAHIVERNAKADTTIVVENASQML